MTAEGQLSSPRPGRFGSARAFLAKQAPYLLSSLLEAALLALVMAWVITYRLIHLEPIEIGGDALTVWEFARDLFYGAEFPDKLNHHTSRFGLVVPTLLTQMLFGAGATTYYIGPICAAVLLHLLVYLLVRRFAGVLAGVFAIYLMLDFVPLERASSQILPETFGPMYTMAAFYFGLLYTDAKRTWTRSACLVAAGVAMFFAYGSKINYLYFAPGLALLVWLGAKRPPVVEEVLQVEGAPRSRWSRVYAWAKAKHLVVPSVLTFIVVGLLLAEAIVLTSTTESGSALSVIQDSHGGLGDKGPRIRTVSDLFALFLTAPSDWVQLLTGAFVAVFGLLAYHGDRRAKIYGISVLIFLFLQTFVVRRISPLTPWTQPHPRYLIAVGAPCIVLISVFLAESSSHIATRVFGARRLENRWIPAVLAACALCLAYGLSRDTAEEWDTSWGKRDFWHRTQARSKDLTLAYQEGLPLVTEVSGGKPVWAAAALLVDPSALMKDGQLLGRKRVTRRAGRTQYLASAVAQKSFPRKRIDAAVRARVRSGQCYVQLRQSSRYMVIKPARGKGCPSLEAQLGGAALPKGRSAKRSSAPRD